MEKTIQNVTKRSDPNTTSSTGESQPAFAPVHQILRSLNTAGPMEPSHIIEISFISVKNLSQSIDFLVKK